MKTKIKNIMMRIEKNKCVQEKADDDYLELWHEREVGIKYRTSISGWVYGNHLLRCKTQEDR